MTTLLDECEREWPLRVFISYAHADKKLRSKLESHLVSLRRERIIQPWTDQSIEAGQEWEEKIKEHLEESHAVLLLISPDFLASKYCYEKEMQGALKRHERGDALVVPIILRPVDWMNAPFAHIQALPYDAKPVTLWQNRDSAMLTVARELRTSLNTFRRMQLMRCIHQDDDVVVISLQADRLILGCPAMDTRILLRTVMRIVSKISEEPGARKILIDLHRLKYIDSSGQGEIVGAYAEAAKNKIPIAFCDLQPRVHDIMVMSKLASVLRIYATRQEAIAALREA